MVTLPPSWMGQAWSTSQKKMGSMSEPYFWISSTKEYTPTASHNKLHTSPSVGSGSSPQRAPQEPTTPAFRMMFRSWLMAWPVKWVHRLQKDSPTSLVGSLNSLSSRGPAESDAMVAMQSRAENFMS